MGFSTDAIHAGQEPDPSTGSVTHPDSSDVDLRAANPSACPAEYAYARGDNPTRRSVRASNVATLEQAEHGIAFGSGMAAIDAVGSLLSTGERVPSSPTTHTAAPTASSRGCPLPARDRARSRVRTSDLDAVRTAMRPDTKMLFVETPTNPRLEITDLAARRDAVPGAGRPLLVVDNTFMTPYFQRPLELGADIVVHSATKYLNGHSDMVGGIVLTSDDELAEKLRFIQFAAGAIPGPFDCWLVLRGIKTLAVRMDRHEANARADRRERLQRPPRRPGDPLPRPARQHPQHELARRQMTRLRR